MLNIIPRTAWGARLPDEVNRIPLPTPRLWVHHTAGSEHGAAGMRSIQNYHMDTKGWNDIAYSFVIDRDGSIFTGRDAGVAGAHTAGDNSSSHAICLMGNFETATPTPAALDALVELAAHGRDAGWWVPTLGGHRDAPGASTRCPGQNLYNTLPDIRTEVRFHQEDDLDMTPTERQKLIDDISTTAALKAVAAIEQRLSTARTPMRIRLRQLAQLGATDALAADNVTTLHPTTDG